MKATLISLLLLAATPALADEAALIAFMGGQGCSIGADSRTAAIAAGHDASAIDALIKTTLADGRAKQERAYTVLNGATCTIRLPDITSPYTVTSPEILAITSPIDEYVGKDGFDDEPGCFVRNAFDVFDTLNGGERGAGFDDYIAFLGAGLISGDLRFYATSPLRTPMTFQNVTGDCAKVPNIDAIRRSHAFIESGFGDHIRILGAEASCDDGRSAHPMPYIAEIQGYLPGVLEEDQPEINAWLWFEYDMITMAAGWHEGLTGTAEGTPRPPLCHYP